MPNEIFTINLNAQAIIPEAFILLGIGVEPCLSLDEFPWMPKERYNIMKQY